VAHHPPAEMAVDILFLVFDRHPWHPPTIYIMAST